MCDKNLLLVSTVEKYPCLYNHHTAEYMKKDVTDIAWSDVAEQCMLSIAECKEKWRNLRYSLLRSLKPNADGTLKKKYYLHNEMEFLLPFIKTKAPGFAPQFDEEYEEEIADVSQDVAVQPPQQILLEADYTTVEPAAKRKRIEQFQNQFQRILCNNDADGSRKLFLLGLLPEVNALTEDQMKAFRRKVLALLDMITEEGSIHYGDGRSISPDLQDIKQEPKDKSDLAHSSAHRLK